MTSAKKTRTVNAGKCATPECEEHAKISGLCPACYAYEYYWTRKKSPAERRHRQKKLKLYESRMDQIAVSSKPRRVK